MPVRIQETAIAWGKKQQAAILTPNIQADFWRMPKINPSLMVAQFVKETDAAWIGKGHEFPTAVYPQSWNVTWSLQKYISSQLLAWVLAYGFGKADMSGSYTYDISPLDPVEDGIELPYFSLYEAIRPTATPSPVLDRLAVGMVVSDFALEVKYGPALANASLTVNCVGCGRIVSDHSHGLVLPATPTTEVLLRSAGLAFTAQTEDYVAAKKVLSLRMAWKNNPALDLGFYPGSGYQDTGDGTTGAIRGRLLVGAARELDLSFDVLLEIGSQEQTLLQSGATGPVVFTLASDASHAATITFPDVQYQDVQFADEAGFVRASVVCAPLYLSSLGNVYAQVKTDIADICQ
jgi:hypothetical protein